MNTTIQIAKKELSVSLYPATVIHANKYSEASGGWSSLPINATLYTDVVFRSKQSGRDWPIYIKGNDFPVYTDQDVIVIGVDDLIVGFIDTQTDRYYYTDTDFTGNFDLGIRLYKVFLIGILSSVVIYFLLRGQNTTFSVVPLIIVFAYYFAQKMILNNRTEKALDNFLSSK